MTLEFRRHKNIKEYWYFFGINKEILEQKYALWKKKETFEIVKSKFLKGNDRWFLIPPEFVYTAGEEFEEICKFSFFDESGMFDFDGRKMT
jgi:hypothetical protein